MDPESYYYPHQRCISMENDISTRQRVIMDYIREQGSVQVDQLAEHLQVTPQTRPAASA